MIVEKPGKSSGSENNRNSSTDREYWDNHRTERSKKLMISDYMSSVRSWHRGSDVTISSPKDRKRYRNKIAVQKVLKSSNPFILFYLKMLYRRSTLPVTEVARIAGKRWSSMSNCEKKKYIDLAKEESKRRSFMKSSKK